jgi:hypothetical protein
MVNVTGKIVNYWTGKPVSNATVMFNDILGTTNENGDYLILNVSPAVYNITIIHKDYERTVITADLRITAAEATVDPIKIKPIFKALP